MLNPRFSSPLAQGALLLAALAVSLMCVQGLAALCAPLFGFSAAEVSGGSAGEGIDGTAGAIGGNPSLSRYLLAVQSIGLFLLPPFLAAMLIAPRRTFVWLGLCRKPMITSTLQSAFLMIAAMPFIVFVAHLNSQMPLPQWATDMEETAMQLTQQLLLVSDTPSFLLNLLIMAVLPAVGEELFFRGYVQRVLQGWVKNPHAAILATALFFSAFHLQFAGFVPRFLLGATMGYLFYWSGSLWLPIVAHFVNNALIICAYFFVTRIYGPDLQTIDAATQGSALTALLSVLIAGWFMYSVFLAEKMRRKMRLGKKNGWKNFF